MLPLENNLEALLGRNLLSGGHLGHPKSQLDFFFENLERIVFIALTALKTMRFLYVKLISKAVFQT